MFTRSRGNFGSLPAARAVRADVQLLTSTRAGRTSLLGAFCSKGGFDRNLETAGMVCTHVGDGEVTCEVTVLHGLHTAFLRLRLAS